MDAKDYNDYMAFLQSSDSRRVWPDYIAEVKDARQAKVQKRNFWKKVDKMCIINGVLHKRCRRKKGEYERPLRVVRNDEKEMILRAEHDCTTGGHPGINKL